MSYAHAINSSSNAIGKDIDEDNDTNSSYYRFR